MKRYRNKETGDPPFYKSAKKWRGGVKDMRFFLLIALFASYIFAPVSVAESIYCRHCGYVFMDKDISIMKSSPRSKAPKCPSCYTAQEDFWREGEAASWGMLGGGIAGGVTLGLIGSGVAAPVAMLYAFVGTFAGAAVGGEVCAASFASPKGLEETMGKQHRESAKRIKRERGAL